MGLKKAVGYIGVFIPILFVAAFLIYFFIIHPEAYSQFSGMTITGYNFEDFKQFYFAKWVNYILLGFLQILFCIGLLKLSQPKIIDRFGFTILLSTAFIWLSYGVFSFSTDISDYQITSLALRNIYVLSITPVAYLLLADNAYKMFNTPKMKFWFFAISFIIILNGVVDIFTPDYLDFIEIFSWFLIHSTYGVMGYCLLDKRLF